MSSFWVIFYTNSHDANITMKSHENHDFGVHTQWIKILFDGAVLFLFLLIHNYLFKSLWPFQNHPFSVDRCSVAELYLIFLSLMHWFQKCNFWKNSLSPFWSHRGCSGQATSKPKTTKIINENEQVSETRVQIPEQHGNLVKFILVWVFFNPSGILTQP